MSETVHYRGKLIYQEKNSPTDTLEEQCKRLLNGEKKPYYDTFTEAVQDTQYQQYVIQGDKLYKVTEFRDIEEYEDIFSAKKINGKDFEFEVKYYNGGCGFDEAIEYALKDAK